MTTRTIINLYYNMQCKTICNGLLKIMIVLQTIMMMLSQPITDENENVGFFHYPYVHRNENVFDEFYGVKIHDPYRWLEDTNSVQTKKFIQDQNQLTMPYLRSCPNRDQIGSKLRQFLRYERFGCPFKQGDKYFIFINTGLQNHHALYVYPNGLDSSVEPELFFDPNSLSKDGTVSLSMSSFSNNGKWWAYGLQSSGSDWNTIKIRSVDSRTDLTDELTNIKFSSTSWTKDDQGFFYSRYPNSTNNKKYDGTHTGINRFNRLYYHRVGTYQHQDILVYETPDQPINRFHAKVSDCGEYIHIFIKRNSEFEAWYFHLLKNGSKIDGLLTDLIPIRTEFDGNYEYLTNDGPIHYMLTNYRAPNGRVIQVNLTDQNSLQESEWRDLIPEHSQDVLRSVRVVHNDILVCHYIRDVMSRLELRNLTNGRLIKEIDIPIGIINSIRGQRKNNSQVFFSISSFLMPTNVYRLKLDDPDPERSRPILFRKATPNNFDANKYITKQTFYHSKDGTKVPLFIVHKRDLVQDGQRPTLLYGYGGFNTMMLPHFLSTRLLFIENLDGIFALAGIRGGGEYGKRWHHNGKLLNKQNVFDDFIEAAQYLIQKNYTSSNKLIIEGASNGGLLVAAVSNQRPELFGCTICHVGVLDMLRYHKFTIGHAWISEYGNPEEEEKYFQYLLKYSPLHNIPQNVSHYPATLLLTADHDDRVVPLHSYKFIAQLQHRLGRRLSNTPFMIRVDTNSGHGGGKPIEKVIEENVDIYSFIINSLSLKYN